MTISTGIISLSETAAPAQVIAMNEDCSSWEEKHWEEIMSILDTAVFNLSAAEAGSGGDENQKEE